MGAIAEPAEAGRYLAEDMYDYPLCFHCVRWSPFMVYLEDNKQAHKFRPFEKGMQLYCAACVPKQADFERKYPGEKLYREESILNDQQLMALLGRFQYEHPNKDGFAELDRVIITENAKLQPYKKLAKKPLPLRCKAALLTDLFPAMHRMENRKFPSYRAMRSAVRAKATAIAEGYMNLTETEQSQLQDNFDVLVDRTPMHAKISSQQQRSLMPPPVTPFRPVTPEQAAHETMSSLGDVSNMSSESRVDALRMDLNSDDESNASSLEGSLARSSQEPSSHAANAPRPPPSTQSDLGLSSQDVSIPGNGIIPGGDSQRVAGTQQTSSESIHLSSQDISDEPNLRVALPAPRITRVNTSDSDSSTASVMSTRSRKRSSSASDRSESPVAVPPTPNDGQQAGPSSKRARNDIPTNPTPAQFVRNPVGRMPRLKGA
ncbi:conserved hypothetical protein [Culex quinquefasciatus]|uniref:Uncharacterized protein n=1 Tax=Culex quinquefasciatus TaxID=7176 RepID=B0WKF1_CULQU|nr:uncharacterized protein LOC6039611 [Culex quinquefasciatus]EDS29770.1 conserved hypothetical protein [Culex quinquefasciatus]|eukprot:XP_001849185.1 conserved hypothetical protein [Culex quinquefasciatus]